jgi:hypothetical protein
MGVLYYLHGHDKQPKNCKVPPDKLEKLKKDLQNNRLSQTVKLHS